MKKAITLKEFVKLVCKNSPDHAIIAKIEDWKTTSSQSLFDDSTLYDVTKDYFKKYLKMFGRTELINYL